MVLAGGGDRVHRRLRDLQRHHGARHPAPRDAVGRLQLLQGDRHVLPARAVDRHPGRDPRPARPRDGASRERRGSSGLALGPHVRDDPGDPEPLLGTRVFGRRRALDGNGLRRRRVLARRRVAVPEARRRDGGGDRADRRAPEPRRVSGKRRTASPLRRGCAGSVVAMDEGFRVEVSFDDEEHGTSLRERLRAVDLDDQARERLGPGVMVDAGWSATCSSTRRARAGSAKRSASSATSSARTGSPPTSA